MAQKGAPTVAGTSQNWTQNASQSTPNPLQKCTGQPYIHTGNAKIADFIAVENQMKIWIIKSHVFHVPVCVSGSNGRPRRPKNAEILSKNSKFFSRTVSGPQLGCPDELWDNLMRVWKLRSSYKTSEQQRSTIGNHRTSIFNFCVPQRRHARWEPSAPFCSLKNKCAMGYPEPQNFTVLLSMFESGVVVVRILTAMVELVGIHFVRTFRVVWAGFYRLRAFFSSFLHDFSQFPNFPSAGTHPFDDK